METRGIKITAYLVAIYTDRSHYGDYYTCRLCHRKMSLYRLLDTDQPTHAHISIKSLCCGSVREALYHPRFFIPVEYTQLLPDIELRYG